MTRSVITAKKMEEVYIEYGLDGDVWSMFYRMTLTKLITDKTWSEFSERCRGWTMDDNGNVVDIDEKVIYKRDKDGFLVKA